MKRLVPLVVGWLTINTATFYPPAAPDDVLQCPMFMWLIEWDNSLLLFDTGGTPPEIAHAMRHTHYRRLPQEAPVVKLRERLGIDPGDIDMVILSHLHWDHAANWMMFPRAEVLVQAQEVRYALQPEPAHRKYFDYLAHPAEYIVGERFTQVRGSLPLPGHKGLQILALPGHTPGSQGLLLEEGDRRIILAGDTVPLSINWQAVPPVPNGIASNAEQFRQTLVDLAAWQAIVLPSHEPALAKYDGSNILYSGGI